MPGTLLSQHRGGILQKARGVAGLFVSRGRLDVLLAAGADLLFPPRCAGCGRVDTHWCETCHAEVRQIPLLRAAYRGTSLTGIAATALHEGKLRKALHALKYENDRAVATRPLGERLVERLLLESWTIDILAPVPLHTARQATRGYNQAQLLGEIIARRLGIPLMSDALIRERNTRSQIDLDAGERVANVAGAFRANAEIVGGQRILLVDDVYTTGATLNACAMAARHAGARAVYGLTVTAAAD